MAGEWRVFGTALATEAGAVFARIGETHRTELGQLIMNDLLDEPGPRELNRRATEQELFLRRLFEGYSEIVASLDAMEHAEIYLRRFPFSKSPITKGEYLKYHVQNYLNEIYILKERLNAFLTALGREYRRDRRHASILAATRPIFSIVKGSLGDVVETRGQHVHARRFSDKDLDRLGLLNLFADPAKAPSDQLAEAVRPYFDGEYRRIRKVWRQRIRNNNETLGTLMDRYAESLLLVVFPTDDRRLAYPANLRAT